MKLLVDIGNTRIKWAFESQGQMFAHGHFKHTEDEKIDAKKFLNKLTEVPKSAAAVNVAGRALGIEISSALEKRFSCKLNLIQTNKRFGEVRNGYLIPEQLGVDRWSAIVGAWQRYRSALCIIDVGSAVTIDLLSSKGQHFGGIILPGLGLMQSVLIKDTSDISYFFDQSSSFSSSNDWYGKSTASAVSKGCLLSITKTIESAVNKFSESVEKPKIVMTGGDAHLLLDNLPIKVEHLPFLVLEGLSLLSNKDIEN